MRRLSPVMCLFLLLAGCNVLAPDDCEIQTVTASAGASVRFDWQDGWRATALRVHEAGHPMWEIRGGIRPPITYGVVPRFAVQDVPHQGRAPDLVPGSTYQVMVYRPQGSRLVVRFTDFVYRAAGGP
jgi:hypothetical protein